MRFEKITDLPETVLGYVTIGANPEDSDVWIAADQPDTEMYEEISLAVSRWREDERPAPGIYRMEGGPDPTLVHWLGDISRLESDSEKFGSPLNESVDKLGESLVENFGLLGQ